MIKTPYSQWSISVALKFIGLFILSTIVLLIIDTWILPFEIFNIAFNLSGILGCYFIFIHPFKYKISEIYNLNCILISPFLILANITIVLARIAVTNGFSDVNIIISSLTFENIKEFILMSNSYLDAIVLAPIWEEFLFRGVFFVILLKRFNLPVAFIISGVIFSLLHITPDTLTNFINLLVGTVLLLTVKSLLYSYVFYRTKSLTIPTLMHITSNILASYIFFVYNKI